METELTTVQREALDLLHREPSEENLWTAIEAFQNVPFFTASGLPFTYTIKRGRDGTYNRELLIDRRENSKTLTWGSIRLAFQNALTMGGDVVKKPKALGDIRGVSYIFPLLWCFGMINVPEKSRRNMAGEGALEQLSFL